MRKSNDFYKALTAVGFSVVFFTACSDGNVSDLEKYIQDVKLRPKSVVPPLPETKVVETFVFKPDGVRDPFRPIQKAIEGFDPLSAEGTGIRPDTERRKEELEAYSLDTLRMMGTLVDGKGFWGLVQAKDGTIHSVQVGNHIGQNYGKIIRILEDKIELIEIVPDTKPGTWREQPASLAITEK